MLTTRRWFLTGAGAAAAAVLSSAAPPAPAAEPASEPAVRVFDLQTATIEDINAAFDAGALTSEKLVQLYLRGSRPTTSKGRTSTPSSRCNPRRCETARALDAERKEKGPRSKLHGMPVVLKDLFDTKDMPTTAGFLPMKNSQPIHDATVVARLRDAGAIILAKVNMSDWFGVPKPGDQSTVLGRTSQSVQPRSHARRLERRHGRRARGRVRADRPGQRNRRLDSQSDREQQRRRPRADARPDSAHGPGHDVVHAGARGPMAPLGLRRRRR